MLFPGGDQVDSGGLNGAVSQNICQPGDIPAYPVEGGCEQVPQVVGKDLAGFHSRLCTQSLHLRPDLSAGETGPVSGEKEPGTAVVPSV